MTRFFFAVSIALILSSCGPARRELPPAPTVGNEVDVPAMLRIGDRLLANGDVSNAVQLYNDALAKEPANIDILMRLGDVAWRLGAFDDAAGYYGQAMSVDPNNTAALLGRARTMMAQENPLGALRLIRQVEDKEGESVESLSAKGLALDLLGRQEDAQVAYAGALDLQADNTLTRANMALSFAISQDYHAAIDIVRRLNDTPAQSDRVREVLAAIYALSGQIDTAVELSGDNTRRAFYTRLPGLTAREKAEAVFFGRLPKLPPAPPPVVMQKDRAPEPEPEPEPEPILDPVEDVPVEQPQSHYWAQVASFRAVAAVEIAWADIMRRLPAVTKDIPPLVQSVESEDGTVNYRLMVGRFPTRGEAMKRCETLREAGVDCVVIRNDMGAQALDDALSDP